MPDDAFDLLEAIEDYVARAVVPLRTRIAELEQELAVITFEKGEPGAAGRDGVDGANGRDGIDGKDGSSGVDGKDGAQGRDGQDGIVDYETIAEMVAATVAKAVMEERPGVEALVARAFAAIEIPPAVVDEAAIVERVRALIPSALPGDKGDKGDPGDKGDKGLDGVDGRRGLSAFEIARQHGFNGDALTWLASMHGKDGADGASVEKSDVVLMVRDAMAEAIAALPLPKDGRDGRDALDGLAEVQCEMSGDRMLELRFVRNGGAVTVHQVKLHHTIYRGVHTDGAVYERGDSVTRDGSTWIALRDTAETPGGAAKDWQLAVKRGRDGR